MKSTHFLLIGLSLLISSQGFAVNFSKVRVAVIVSRYHEHLTKPLLEGTQKALFSQGVPSSQVNVIDAPGSFEIPMLAQKAARSGKYDAVICLGVVLLNSQTRDMSLTITQNLQKISLDHGIPVTNGVVSVERLEELNDLGHSIQPGRGTVAATAAMKSLEALERI